MIVGVIGPTDLQKFCVLLEKPAEELLERAAQVGKALAESPVVDELWVNPDGGMIGAVAHAYKDFGGKRLVVLVPRRAIPWPLAHVRPYTRIADEVRRTATWFTANHEVVTMPHVCVCVGLSSGTLSELAYIKWDAQFSQGNLRRLIAIRELLRDGVMPPEIYPNIAHIVQFLERAEELRDALERLGFNNNEPLLLHS